MGIVADPGCRLLEVDYAGIEQVVMGWFMRDPHYIRIAKLGTHAIVASNVLKRPIDLSWPNDRIAAACKAIKRDKDPHVHDIYDRSKRCVHGTAYDLTPLG